MPNPPHPYHHLVNITRQYGAVLVVVSKTRTEKEIREIYEMGQRIFAENRAQELIEKATLLPADIEWHLIGHLQSNKIKSVIPYVAYIQSLDSWKLWLKLQKEAHAAGKQINCLLQLKIAEEESKYGWNYPELEQILQSGLHKTLSNIIIRGVMGMTTLTTNKDQVRKEMKQLKFYFEALKQTYFKDETSFTILSMGMSGDYTIALEERSNMIRVGSLLFE